MYVGHLNTKSVAVNTSCGILIFRKPINVQQTTTNMLVPFIEINKFPLQESIGPLIKNGIRLLFKCLPVTSNKVEDT